MVSAFINKMFNGNITGIENARNHLPAEVFQNNTYRIINPTISSHYRNVSGKLPGCMSGCPGPVDIVATQHSGHINHFADEIEAGRLLCLHGL